MKLTRVFIAVILLGLLTSCAKEGNHYNNIYCPAKCTYDFICSFPGHSGLMKGKFIVA